MKPTLRIVHYLGRHLPHYLVLCALAVVCVFPFWWTLVTALSTEGNIFAFPPTLWPRAPSLRNFGAVFDAIPMLSFYKNSILIALCTVFWKLLLCSMAAYPLARLRFRGRKLVFGLILATLVLPNVVTAVAILLLKQAFDEVPQDLVDAARVDGASEWTIFSKIMLPLIAPWLATVGILTAVESWNEYIWPSIVMSKPDEFPLSVGVLYLRGTFGSSTRVIAAGTILTILPTLAAFLFTQRFFMRGMDGAVK